MKYILLLIAFLSAGLSAETSKIVTGKFSYMTNQIELVVYSETGPEQRKPGFNKGNLYLADITTFIDKEIYIGWSEERNNFNYKNIFYFDKNEVINIGRAHSGFFIKHGSNVYVISEDTSEPHVVVSSLKKLYLAKDGKIKAKEIYRFPGYFLYSNTEHEHLLVSGYVNTEPFAVAVDDKGIWHELQHFPPKMKK